MLHDAISIANSFVSIKLLTKAESSLQTSKGPRRACVSRRQRVKWVLIDVGAGNKNTSSHA